MKLPSNPVGAHPSTYKGHLVSLEVLCHYAKKGDVKELPQEVWNREAIKVRQNSDGNTALHWIARSGCLLDVDSIKDTDGNINLTSDELNLENNFGDTILHNIATRGQINLLKPEVLAEVNFCKANKKGMTQLHSAAAGGSLHQVPKDFLVLENLKLKNKSGYSVFHLAAKFKHLDQIPEELLNHENLSLDTSLGDNIYQVAAEYGSLSQIPEHLLTDEVLLKTNPSGNSSPVQMAAMYGHFEQIPKRLYRQEVFMMENNLKETTLMLLGQGGQLGLVPEEFLTWSNLRHQCNHGFDAIHLAARESKLHLVPKHLLNEKTLYCSNKFGFTALHSAGKNGQIKDIPPEFITYERMMQAATNGETPLQRLHDCIKDSVSEIKQLPVLTAYGLTMPQAERVIWYNELKAFKVPNIEHLKQNWEHLTPQGSWSLE